MEVLELKKRYAALYKPSAKVPSIVEVPPLRFLMLDGVGGVGGPDVPSGHGFALRPCVSGQVRCQEAPRRVVPGHARRGAVLGCRRRDGHSSDLAGENRVAADDHAAGAGGLRAG